MRIKYNVSNLSNEIKRVERIQNSTDSAIQRLEELFGPLPLWTPKKIRSILYKFQYYNNIDLSSLPEDLFFNI